MKMDMRPRNLGVSTDPVAAAAAAAKKKKAFAPLKSSKDMQKDVSFSVFSLLRSFLNLFRKPVVAFLSPVSCVFFFPSYTRSSQDGKNSRLL